MHIRWQNRQECKPLKESHHAILAWVSFAVLIICLSLFFGPSTGSNTYAASQNEFDSTIEIESNCGSTQSILKQYLLDSGYNETATAGIMGNIAIESCWYRLSVYGGTCNNNAPDDFVAWAHLEKQFEGGYGLVQWTSRKRVKKLQEYANSLNKKVNDTEVQVKYIVKELKSSSYRLTPLVLNSMTLPEVTWVILRDYLVPSTIVCVKGEGYNCQNQESARGISLSSLLNDPSKYQSAYETFVKRYNEAKQLYGAVNDSCSTDDNPSKESNEKQDPKNDQEKTETIINGPLGEASSKGYYSQCNSSYSKIQWRADGSTICQSGQSLIAVANAAKYLNVKSSDPITLATWSKENIKDITQTGWKTQNMSIPRLISQLGLSQRTKWLWINNIDSYKTKLEKIRKTLSQGGVIIAQGKREDDKSVNCSDRNNMSAGLCVFSTNGHFITIIGITNTDELIVANVAHGKNGDKSSDGLPAEAILNVSNKAMAVFDNEK